MRPRSRSGWLAVAAVLAVGALLALVLTWALGSMGSYPPPESQSVPENDRYDVTLGIATLSGLSLLVLGALTAAALRFIRHARRVSVAALRDVDDLQAAGARG